MNVQFCCLLPGTVVIHIMLQGLLKPCNGTGRSWHLLTRVGKRGTLESKTFPWEAAVREIECVSPSEPTPDLQGQAQRGDVTGYFVAPKLNESLTLAKAYVSFQNTSQIPAFAFCSLRYLKETRAFWKTVLKQPQELAKAWIYDSPLHPRPLCVPNLLLPQGSLAHNSAMISYSVAQARNLEKSLLPSSLPTFSVQALTRLLVRSNVCQTSPFLCHVCHHLSARISQHPQFKSPHFILAPSPVYLLQHSQEKAFKTNPAMYTTGPLVGISGVATRM